MRKRWTIWASKWALACLGMSCLPLIDRPCMWIRGGVAWDGVPLFIWEMDQKYCIVYPESSRAHARSMVTFRTICAWRGVEWRGVAWDGRVRWTSCYSIT